MSALRTAGWALLLGGCGGTGDWVVETWGEDYIEEGLPPEVFADGCSVVFDEFVVSLASVRLLDGNGAEVGAVPPHQVFDLVVAGPTAVGTVEVPPDHYDALEVRIAPDPDGVPATATADQVAELVAAGASLLVDGTLACGGASARFRWAFEEDTVYGCEPPDLTVPSGGSDGTQVTVHGDHLFYNGLVNADAVVRGTEILAADADQDGEITRAELAAVSVPALGFQVGEFSDVTDLDAFVAHLSRTIGHVDGEGECRVDF